MILGLAAFSSLAIGMLYIDAKVFSYLTYLLAGAAIFIFAMVMGDKTLNRFEKERVIVLFAVVFFVIFFWSAFEQAGASLTFFAEEQTQRDLGFFTVPSSWFQSLNSVFVVAFAPIFAWLWIKLGKKDPSAPTKMAIGLMLLAIGYLWIAFGVKNVGTGIKVSMIWLIGMYMLHTWGELCLSPIGLSLANKLAPFKYASLLMAVWFLGNAFANKLAGVLSGLYPENGKTTQFLGYQMTNLYDFFILFVVMAGVASLILFMLTKKLQTMMHTTEE
jgi:POT family proton-dependent oligopeptide transporter